MQLPLTCHHSSPAPAHHDPYDTPALDCSIKAATAPRTPIVQSHAQFIDEEGGTRLPSPTYPHRAEPCSIQRWGGGSVRQRSAISRNVHVHIPPNTLKRISPWFQISSSCGSTYLHRAEPGSIQQRVGGHTITSYTYPHRAEPCSVHRRGRGQKGMK